MRRPASCWFHTLLSVTVYSQVCAFNLETRLPIVKEGPQGSFFGYSIAEHQITGPSDSLLLVGAPRGNTGQPDTNITGVVYRCPLSTYVDDCTPVVTHSSSDLSQPPQEGVEKDDQWLGVAISSQGPGKYVVICAHRFVREGADYRYGYGVCYALQPDLDYWEEYSGCYGRETSKGHEQYGYCQFGTDVELASDNSIVFGAPGAYTWTGTAFLNTLGLGIRDDIKWYQTPLEEEGTAPVEPYSMLGYSVTSGRLIGKSKKMAYVSGAPKANGDSGKVVVFTKQNSAAKNGLLTVIASFAGEEKMAYFGHSSTVIDLNNDGYLDLIVGAPYYRSESGDKGGAIYIYMNGPETPFQSVNSSLGPIKITSSVQFAQFGFAVKNIGDINHDGFMDLAVGAPGENGGTVYIFSGSKNGVIRKPMQVVKSKELPGGPYKSFGYSISGTMDMDGNGYPDVAVGAYESGKTVLLMARPVIDIDTDIKVSPTIINPWIPDCPDKSGYACFQVIPCFKFTAHPVDKFLSRILIEYTILGDVGNKEPILKRVFFKSMSAQDGQSAWKIVKRLVLVQQARQRFACGPRETVYVKANPAMDILNPIEFKIKSKLVDRDPAPLRPGDRLPNIDSFPIVSELTGVEKFQVDFFKECGSDDVCHSDLQVETSWNVNESDGEAKFVLGDESELVLTITITNTGEPAYEAELEVFLPEFVDSFTPETSSGVFYSPAPENSSSINFQIGNPLLSYGKAEVKIKVDTSTIPATAKEFNVDIIATTASEELTPENNNVTLQARIILRAEVDIIGYTTPKDQVLFSGEVVGATAMSKEEDIGSPLQHVFHVTNHGPGRVGKSQVKVWWPFEVEGGRERGKYLLYMITIPELHGPGECLIDPKYVNPLLLQENLVMSVSYRQHVTGHLGSTDKQLDPELLYKPASKILHQHTEMLNDVSYKEEQQGKIRRKREILSRVKSEEILDHRGKRQKVVTMDCARGTAKCFQFVCNIGELGSDETAVIRIRARLWNSTLVADYSNVDYVQIISRATVEIDPSLNVEQNVSNDSAFVVTKAYPDALHVEVEQEIPLWVIIVSVAAGVIVLILIIVVLCLLGFFKRDRPKMETVTLEKSTANDWH